MLACGLCIVVTCEGASEAGSVEVARVLSEQAAGDRLSLLPLPQTPISICQDAYNTPVKTFDFNSLDPGGWKYNTGFILFFSWVIGKENFKEGHELCFTS